MVNLFLLIQAFILAPTALGLQTTRHQDPVGELGKHNNTVCDNLAGMAFLEKYKLEGEMGEEFVSTSHPSSSASTFKCAARWSKKTSEEAAADDFICRGHNLRLLAKEGTPLGLQVWPGSSWKLPAGQNLKLKALYESIYDVALVNADPDHNGCDETYDDGTLVIYEAVRRWNPYEGGHQLLMLYASVVALKLDPTHLRVMFTKPSERDVDKDVNWMNDFASAVFSQGGSMIYPSTAASTTCAKNVVIPIGGMNSMLLQNIGKDDPSAASCRGGAPLLLGMKQYVIQAMRVQPAQPEISLGDRVLMPLRLPTQAHPEPFKRTMENYEEVADALGNSNQSNDRLGAFQAMQRDALAVANAFLKHGSQKVTMISPETLSIVEQVQHFANADSIVAPHSAALFWMYLMPQCGQILEYCTGGDFHYVNEAHYAGLDHYCLSGISGWGSPSFKADIQELVRKKQVSLEAWQKCVIAGAKV